MTWITCMLCLAAAGMITVPLMGDRNLRSFFVGAGKTELKMIRRRFLYVAIALLAINQLLFLDTYYLQDGELRNKSQDLFGQVNLLNYLKDQLQVINANREKLADANQQLASRLADYPDARPAMQKYVEDNQADLQVMDAKCIYLTTWVDGWQNKLAKAATATAGEDRGPFQFQALNDQRVLDKKMAAQCNYVFEYAIDSLRASLTEQARQMGETLDSTYSGLPPTLQTNVIALGSFSLGEQPPRYYFLSLKRGTSKFDPNCLCVTCVETAAPLPAALLGRSTPEEAQELAGSGKILYTLNLQPEPDKIVSTFQMQGEAALSESFPQADYGRGVNVALSRLYATQVVKNNGSHAGGWN